MSSTTTGGNSVLGSNPTSTGGSNGGSSSDGNTNTGFGGAPSATATGKSSASNVIVSFGRVYGLAVVVAGFMGGFALLL